MMAAPRRLDVYFHLIPPFYREAVYAAGRGPARGKYPDWTPELALDVMEAHGSEVALTSLAEIAYSLDALKFDGVSLFASYGENFLGDPRFDPLFAMLTERGAVVFIHPGLHPSSRGLAPHWPAFMMEYLFDTTR